MATRLRERIRRAGAISFPEFIASALYDPEDGYYARPSGQVGRDGDFFTSVSTGPLFGRLLARHIAAWHREAGSPDRWRIIETGANDGTLAADILAELARLSADSGLRYTVVEPLPRLAGLQRDRLAGADVVADASSLEDDPLPSFVFGNEVIDALPFHVIESDGGGWIELGVALDGTGDFIWHPLGRAVMASRLPVFPAGYRTEIRTATRGFLKPLAAAMSGGRMLWIDYGFPRDDYYHESRTTGTLRTFRDHHAAENPLDHPGEIDITAHVDFTALAEDLESLGGEIRTFEPQDRFLTKIARPWLLEMEGRTDEAAKKELRAFQTLTHPGHLGSRFHAMEAAFPLPTLPPASRPA